MAFSLSFRRDLWSEGHICDRQAVNQLAARLSTCASRYQREVQPKAFEAEPEAATLPIPIQFKITIKPQFRVNPDKLKKLNRLVGDAQKDAIALMRLASPSTQRREALSRLAIRYAMEDQVMSIAERERLVVPRSDLDDETKALLEDYWAVCQVPNITELRLLAKGDSSENATSEVALWFKEKREQIYVLYLHLSAHEDPAGWKKASEHLTKGA
ncbi:MAG: hypothetical protein M1814_006297 [Vezdaea aestivalis]|nr:MAG: hypothetical protein M1814_006297 [Vezdaea aestivalis]